ncbi:eukaryotic peptide chain release factor subunit 1 [Striga asiatica]|uniref:Eukaryotic peptide chain release factor subunit 1 n=1 Tax=Striga asiatica TaxID=4170 RepID=A0A5A7QA36_STRAF|nr:eukaryotic peptide chain release factor subunit 1 [Striga asiatica]
MTSRDTIGARILDGSDTAFRSLRVSTVLPIARTSFDTPFTGGPTMLRSGEVPFEQSRTLWLAKVDHSVVQPSCSTGGNDGDSYHGFASKHQPRERVEFEDEAF